MAGCCVVFLAMIFLPLLIIFLLAFLGLLAGAVLTFLISAVLLIVLSGKGIFRKYADSDVKWKRYAAKSGQVLLIVLMIGSVLCIGAEAWIAFQIGLL